MARLKKSARKNSARTVKKSKMKSSVSKKLRKTRSQRKSRRSLVPKKLMIGGMGQENGNIYYGGANRFPNKKEIFNEYFNIIRVQENSDFESSFREIHWLNTQKYLLPLIDRNLKDENLITMSLNLINPNCKSLIGEEIEIYKEFNIVYNQRPNIYFDIEEVNGDKKKYRVKKGSFDLRQQLKDNDIVKSFDYNLRRTDKDDEDDEDIIDEEFYPNSGRKNLKEIIDELKVQLTKYKFETLSLNFQIARNVKIDNLSEIDYFDDKNHANPLNLACLYTLNDSNQINKIKELQIYNKDLFNKLLFGEDILNELKVNIGKNRSKRRRSKFADIIPIEKNINVSPLISSLIAKNNKLFDDIIDLIKDNKKYIQKIFLQLCNSVFCYKKLSDFLETYQDKIINNLDLLGKAHEKLNQNLKTNNMYSTTVFSEKERKELLSLVEQEYPNNILTKEELTALIEKIDSLIPAEPE